MSPVMTLALRWLRRALCIFGGAALGAVFVVIYAVIHHFDPDRLGGFLATACPVAGTIGAAVGALIVFRAERIESKTR
jgi:hypothetical protein